MQSKYDDIIQEVDAKMSPIDLNGKLIIEDCKMMIGFLKERLTETKSFLSANPFESEAEEIHFFKYQKPTLLGRLIYFYEILHIESQRPIDNDTLDDYYEKRQEELKIFFDRHVAFFQYYRSGSTHMDGFYFLRDKQQMVIDLDMCSFNDDIEFSTGYDNLVAKVIAMEMLYAFLSFRRTCLQYGREGTEINLLKVKGSYEWTGSVVELSELVYALGSSKCINNGNAPITELATLFGAIFGVDLRDCYGMYTDMKKRKNSSRTYFLDKMSKELNKKMERDENKERMRK